MTRDSVTLEVRRGTTPEALLAGIRDQAPGLLREGPQKPPPASGGDIGKLLTPAEVAALFRVDSKTVTRWARTGRLTSIRTLGGHRRYREAEVRALIDGSDTAGPDGE